jgi:hypothetical protein
VTQRYAAGETLVKASGCPMPWEYTCAVTACNTSPRTPNRYCQFHQRRFQRFGDPLGTKPLLMNQHGTVAGYQRRRCRCDLCRQSNAAQRLEYVHRVHPEMRRYKPRGTVTDSS